MSFSDALHLPRSTTDAVVAPDKETFERRFGMTLDEVRVLLQTKDGERQLLKRIQDALATTPNAAAAQAEVDKILPLVGRNVEQLRKKESFLSKVVSMPLRAIKAVGKTIVKHPILSAIGVAGVIALLIYLFGPAAGTVGMFGHQVTKAFEENVLRKVPVPTPEAGFSAVADVPAASGLAGPEAFRAAAESVQSPAATMYMNMDAAKAAGLSDQALKAISDTSRSILANPTLATPEAQMKALFDTIPPTP